MKTKIISVILLFTITLSITSADDQLDVKNDVNNMRNATRQPGILGDIFTKIFDTNGKIKEAFLSITNTATNGYIPMWNNLQLVDSPIYSTGGLVGLGTNNPLTKFDVNGTIRSNLSFNLKTSGTELSIYEDIDSAGWTRFRPVAGSGFYFSNNGDNPNLTIGESGKVGIGTSTPDELLTIVGGLNLSKDPDSGDDVANRDYNDLRYQMDIGAVSCTNGIASINDLGIVTCASTPSDTNAGTECIAGEYLDGDGTCKTERYNSAYDTETEIDAAVANNGYDTTPDTIADDGVIDSGEILDNTITESDINDSFVARDSDKLDGLDSTNFVTKGNTSVKTLNTGWYTIAKNIGNRASAKFTLRETKSSYHQAVHFYAQHHFGKGNVINTLADSSFGNNGAFRYIRIKDASTYDGALLQVYVDADTTPVYAEMLENIQSTGWEMVDWAADGTISTPDESILSQAVIIDLDVNNGIQTTDNINTLGGYKVDGITVVGGDAYVEGDRIRQGTVDGSEIEDNTISTSDILDNTITETDISDSFKARDSDKLDAIDSSQFVRSDTYDVVVGNHEVYGTDTTGNYTNAPIEIREVNLVNTSQSADAYAPAQTWHWGGRVQGQLALESDGIFRFRDGSTHSTLKTVDAAQYRENGTALSSKYLGISAKAADADKLDGYNSSQASTASTVAVRNSSGDINARLFRSEYDSTNATVNYIMTQIDTVSNNYIRPTTPAQFRAAVTDATYINVGETGDSIADGTIDSSEIQDNSLTAADLAPNSVGNSELIDSPAFTNPTVATPTASTHVANKAYVDNAVVAAGTMNWKTGYGCGACPYGSYTAGSYYKYCYRRTSGGVNVSHGAQASMPDYCAFGTSFGTSSVTFGFRSY